MKKFAFAVLMISLAVAAGQKTWSQEEDDYIDKLESRLMALEQKMYSTDRNVDRTVPEGLTGDKAVLADFEIRMQQLEGESQKLYGAVEELGHLVRDFAKRTDGMTKDFDMRISDIENGAASMKKSTADLKEDMHAAKGQKESDKKAQKKSETKGAKASTVDTSFITDDMDADTVYNKAYNFLMATAYSDAEKWMKGFIAKFPSDELADNAHYWLGEIYLVQGEPEQAVVSFTTGISKFPHGVKAPANLLKMGVAFKRIGKADFAKSAWNKLIKDFPNAPEMDKAKKELDKLALEETAG